MTTGIHIVCPECLATNRLPQARLDQAPKCGRCKSALFAGHPISLTGSSFRRQIENNAIPVVVDFWAPWCGPCKMMAPELERAARELEPEFRLAKVDTDAEPSLGSEFDIRGIPTLILFRNAREQARHSGAMRAAEIVAWARKASTYNQAE
jgi:thioredoxin 2